MEINKNFGFEPTDECERLRQKFPERQHNKPYNSCQDFLDNPEYWLNYEWESDEQFFQAMEDGLDLLQDYFDEDGDEDEDKE